MSFSGWRGDDTLRGTIEMSDGTASRMGWGILLSGQPSDLEVWQEALKRFDPCIIKTDEGLILRSKLFDSATTLSDAHEFGKTLLERLNGALGASAETGMVRLEKVVEFLPDGQPTPHVIAGIRITEPADRISATVVAHGPDGNPLPPPPPEPSRRSGGLRSQRMIGFSPTRSLISGTAKVGSIPTRLWNASRIKRRPRWVKNSVGLMTVR